MTDEPTVSDVSGAMDAGPIYEPTEAEEPEPADAPGPADLPGPTESDVPAPTESDVPGPTELPIVTDVPPPPAGTDAPPPPAGVLVPTDIAQPLSPEDAEVVSQPAKLMRIASMAKQLLEEVRAAPLDDASRKRMREIYRESIRQLEQTLSPELADELDRLTIPFDSDPPTDAELRVAQGQLVGWLAGLFQGIQATLFVQQMAAQRQLEQMRGVGTLRDPDANDGGPHRTPYL